MKTASQILLFVGSFLGVTGSLLMITVMALWRDDWGVPGNWPVYPLLGAAWALAAGGICHALSLGKSHE